ncbi:MAG: pantoate--beta-alanine ligase [Bacteroidales bacterium]
MKTVTHKTALQKAVGKARKEGKRIGLVPTMGALHEGHLSLIRAAMKNNDFIIVTLFVNPTQFNNPNDLERYPRDMDSDLKLLKAYPVDIVFAPSVKEMYPEKDNRVFDLSPFDRIMEGKFRPGHFNGVAQIVSKLFYAANPDTAYFGQKDFQQLAVIKKLVAILHLNIKIIGCPIIREEDGLAMSSRNRLLTPPERAAAPLIYQTLLEAKQIKSRRTPDEIKAFVKSAINNHPLIQVEYFEIVDDQNLLPVKNWQEPNNKVGCIAVQLGNARLIDNIYFC